MGFWASALLDIVHFDYADLECYNTRNCMGPIFVMEFYFGELKLNIIGERIYPKTDYGKFQYGVLETQNRFGSNTGYWVQYPVLYGPDFGFGPQYPFWKSLL